MIAMHPGEYIKAMYLDGGPYFLETLSKKIGVSTDVLTDLIQGKTSVDPDLAGKLSLLGRSKESWLYMQECFDKQA